MKAPLLIDGSNASKPNGSVVYAKNKVLDYLKNNIRNEDGFYEDYIIDDTVEFCGVVETPTRLVLFIKRIQLSSTLSKIQTLEIINNLPVFTTILQSDSTVASGLNFSPNNPIQGEFTFNVKGELIISWIEGLGARANSLRYLNIDNVGFPIDANKEAVNAEDYYKLNSDKKLNLPIMTYPVVRENGMLPIGEYTLYVAYSDKYGNNTHYIGSMNPFTIYKGNSGDIYTNVFDTDDLDAISSKSIRINISNLNTNYSYLSIGVIHQINDNKTAYRKIVKYAGNAEYITIEDLITLDQIDVQDIVIDNTIIHKANAITKFDSELLIGAPTTQSRIDYTNVACNITVGWTTVEVNSTIEKVLNTTAVYISNTYKGNTQIVDNKLFLFDEVYALYIRPVFTSGEKGEAFHIPGRSFVNAPVSITSPDGLTTGVFNRNAKLFIGTSTSGGGIIDDSTIDQVDVRVYTQYAQLETFNTGAVKLFQIENFGTSTGGMSYWENEHEVYPSAHPLGGQKVRHHKTPSYAIVHGTAAAVANEYQNGVLKLELSNIDFSSYPEVQGYEIMIAARDQVNKTIIDEAAIYNSFTPDATANVDTPTTSQLERLMPVVQPGEIYKAVTSGTRTEYTAVKGIREGDNKRLFGYAPKTMKYNDPLIANYLTITNIFQIENIVTIESTGNINPQGINNKRTTTADLTAPLDDILFDSTESTEIKAINKYPTFVINESQMIVGDGIGDDNIYLHYAEAAIYLKLKTEGLEIISNDVTTDNVAQAYEPGRVFTMSSTNLYAKAQLKRYVDDIYLNVETQRLIKVYQSNIPATPTNIIEISGDGFYSGIAMRVGNRRVNNVCILPYISEVNFELRTPTNREEVVETIATPIEDNFWHPNINTIGDYWVSWGAGPETYTSYRHKWLGRSPDVFEYWGVGIRSIKSDWSLMDSYKGGVVYDINSLFTDTFPFRIYRSLPMLSEELFEAWRTFAPTSYEELDPAKGLLQTLDVLGQGLYCRQRYALTVYSVIPTMDVQDATVALGTHGIFHNKGQEVIADELGYIGSNSRFNSLVTPFGYFVMDVIKGEVYKVTGITALPITLGVIGDLKRHIAINLTNPYTVGDYILGFNDKDKLVLLSCIDNTNIPSNEFTLSYPVYNDAMFSFHSYTANIYARTSIDLFSINNFNTNKRTSIYRHNNIDVKCMYYANRNYNREVQQDILDMVFNGGNEQMYTNKLIDYVTWVTDSKVINSVTKNIKTLQDKTIDAILVYSDTQATEIKDVKTDNLDWYEVEFGRNQQNAWTFNNVLDNVDNPNDVIIDENFELNIANIIPKDYYDLSNFIGTFVVVRLIHNNTAISNGSGGYDYVTQFINVVNVKFNIDNR